MSEDCIQEWSSLSLSGDQTLNVRSNNILLEDGALGLNVIDISGLYGTDTKYVIAWYSSDKLRLVFFMIIIVDICCIIVLLLFSTVSISMYIDLEQKTCWGSCGHPYFNVCVRVLYDREVHLPCI